MRKHGSGFFLKAITLFGIAVFALSACGGGGSDSVSHPSEPANLTAAAGDNSVVLNWPSVSHAATYNVYYGTSSPVTKSSTKITGSVSAPKTITGLTNGTPYFFAVSAVNAGGESALSVERSATPSATPPPGIPTNIRATAGDNQATVSWDNVDGATSYNIYYGTATGVTKASVDNIIGVESPRIVTGLANGTTYFFVVTAVNGDGESAVSFEASAKPSATPPPAAPSLTSATSGNAKVTLAWGAVAGATSYNVYYGTATGVTKASGTPVAGVTSPHDVTGLTNGTPYFFVVTAENGNGESGVSFEVSATPTATPPPAAPSLTSATAGNTQVTLAWGAVAGATSYNVYRGTASGVTKISGTKFTGVSSPYDATGLTNGTPYFFVVTAVGTGGESAESNERSATPTAPAGAFSQADLTGSWKVNMLLTSGDGTENGWTRATGTADASGNVTVTSIENSDGTNTGPAPGTLQWTIDGSGVVSESGISADDNVHMTMTSNKNFIAGTAGSGGRNSLRIFQKVVSGTSYSNADLQNKSFVIHNFMVGADNTWNRSDGTIDGSGNVSLANDIGPGGDSGPQPNTAIISVDGSGTVTIDGLTSFKGFLSADKKTVVGTFTETDAGNTWHHIMIIQITGQTYAAADLVGTSSGHTLGVGNANFWSHYTTTGAVGGGITFSSYLDSSGGTTAPSAVTASITSAGTVTLSDPSFQFHGTMSFDKKFTVITQTNGVGIYSLSIMTQ